MPTLCFYEFTDALTHVANLTSVVRVNILQLRKLGRCNLYIEIKIMIITMTLSR